MRARCQGLAMGAFMIALAADAPPAIVECRQHKPASEREYPQLSIAFGSRSATWARAMARSRWQGDESRARPAVAPAREDGSPLLPRQNFPLNLPPNRRLCSTGGERIVEGWTAHCCVASAARSRAATMTNLARASLALILPALFGAAKSCALVKFSMICPHWSPSRRPTTNQIVLLITAISWHLCEHVEGESRGGRRMQIVRAADDIHRSGMPGSRSAARARAIARSR
jgi:hypothetical protein